MSKTIKIFISSSIRNEFAQIRNEIETFFGRKNSTYNKYELFFQPEICEDFDNYVSNDGSQELYNQKIKESDYMLLFYSYRVGKYTREEAINALNGNIKTYVYKIPFTQNIQSEEEIKSVKDFEDYLVNTRKYFHENAPNTEGLLLNFYNKVEPDCLDYIKTQNERKSAIFYYILTFFILMASAFSIKIVLDKAIENKPEIVVTIICLTIIICLLALKEIIVKRLNTIKK